METSNVTIRRLKTFLEEIKNNFAKKTHSHATSEITGLDTALSGKANSSHTHDDRYYTETEIDTKLSSKVDLSADGVSTAINKLSTGDSTPSDADYYISQYVSGGTTTTSYHRRPMSALWEYIKGKISSVLGLTSSSYGGNAASATKVNGHTVNSDVPANAKFTDTNTWRGVQDNLTSTATDQSLSANQGKVLKGLVDGKLSLSGGTLTGRVARSGGGSWISDRNNVALFGTATSKDAYNCVVGQKTPNGAWTIGNLASNEKLVFNYTTDTNFNTNNNTATTVYLPNTSGTIALQPTTYNVTVAASSWSGSAAPYSATISIAKATTSNVIEVAASSSATSDQITAIANAMICNGTQAAGSITLKAYGEKPTVALPLTVVVFG